METLKYGNMGPYVQMLQLALQRAGFYDGDLDGIFGTHTESSVLRFQQAFGLTADGVVGTQTWQKLSPFLRGYARQKLQRGDTFWQLAKTYGTTASAIRTANPDVTPESMHIGQVLTIPYGFDVVPTNIAYTYALVEMVIDGLAARYPFLSVAVIGKSVMGRNIQSIAIGSGNRELSFNAAHHANEWLTVPLVLKYLEDYALAYVNRTLINGEDAQRLYTQTKLYLVPLVNPDGVDLVTGAINAGSYYNQALSFSENYPAIRFPSGWKANIAGTDLNLNYPANWEKAREIKFAQGFTSPAPRDYVGSAPLSAPESRAMYQFTLNHDFRLILAYHTQGKLIYWKYGDFEPPRSRAIGEALSEASGYALELTPESSGYAGYKDWFIQEFNLPGYTVEAGEGLNPLPLSQFDEMYRDNSALMTEALKQIL